jgi:MoaA/NifB/PqqE/SkfB family radical SAM enzyme
LLKRIDLENRTKLEMVIPLSTPFIINVDPSDACNFQCSFCPTGNRPLMKSINRPLKSMDFDLFKRVIDSTHEFDTPIKVLRLYKDGEPLANKNFAKMVKYAKEQGNILRVDTTTNASLLTPQKSLEIIDAGLDKINISVEGMNAKQYMDFSKYKIDFDQFVENIRFFYENKKDCEVIVKINGDTLTKEEQKSFLDTFQDISDGAYIEHIMSCWPEFELGDGLEVNQKYGIYGQEIKEVNVCPYPFYSFSINSDGQASLCFLDWSRKLIIGDVTKESLKDIWLGDEIREYQKMFLEGKRKTHTVCKDCGQLSHGMPDDIDMYADEILKKYE